MSLPEGYIYMYIVHHKIYQNRTCGRIKVHYVVTISSAVFGIHRAPAV